MLPRVFSKCLCLLVCFVVMCLFFMLVCVFPGFSFVITLQSFAFFPPKFPLCV